MPVSDTDVAGTAEGGVGASVMMSAHTRFTCPQRSAPTGHGQPAKCIKSPSGQ